MPETRATIIIDVKNEGAKEVKALGQQFQNTNAQLTSLTNVVKGDGVSSWTKFTGALKDARVQLLALGGVMAAGIGIYKTTVGFTLDYAKQVRELGRAIGATAEDSSKLIAAADDVFVSFETLKMGMIAAIRNGLSPTIEGIGALADQYRAIEDPIAQTKFLTDNFGRSGADLAPLLALGSAGIRDLGKAAEETGMVMSESALASATGYGQAMDQLGDRVDGLKKRIGEGLIPSLLSAATALDTLLGWNQRITGALAEHSTSVAQTSNNYAEYVAEMARAAEVGGMKTRMEEGSLQIYEKWGNSLKNVTGAMGVLSESEWNAVRGGIAAKLSIDEIPDVTNKYVYIHYIKTGGGTDITADNRAGGGALNGAAEVGEQGSEGILPKPGGGFMVVPHSRWMQMKGNRGWGGKGFRVGGEFEDPEVYVPDTKLEPYPGWNPMDWTRPASEAVGGGGPTPPSVEETAAAVTSAIPETIAPLLTTQMQQTAATGAETNALLKTLIAETRKQATDSGVGGAVATALQQTNMMG